MQLKLSWADNPDGEPFPIDATKPTLLSATVIDEATGKSTDAPYEVTVVLGNEQLNVARVNGESAEYLVPKLSGLLQFPKLVVRATPSRGGVALVEWRRVVSSALQSFTAGARFVVALVLLYACILVPNIQGELKLLSESPAFPIISTAVLLLGWLRHRVARSIRHPVLMGSAALAAIIVMVCLFVSRRLVVNQSLDAIDLPEGGRLEPGAYVIASTSWFDEGTNGASKDRSQTQRLPGDARCWLNGTMPRNLLPNDEPDPATVVECVRFGSTPDVGLLLASSLLLRRASIGCQDRHPARLFGTPIEAWRKTASCQPRQGLLVEAQKPEQSIANYNSPHLVDLVTAQLSWRPQTESIPAQLKWPDASQLLTVDLQPWPEKAGTARDYVKNTGPFGFVFHGDAPKLTFETNVDLGAKDVRILLTPTSAASGGVLDADVRVGQTVTGKLSARVAAKQPHPCWVSRSGERLLEVLFRDSSGQNYSKFHSELPEVVSDVPICWTGSSRPDFAELHLDQSWVPSEGWALELPAQLSPQRLSILDQHGQAWGELKCPAAAETSKDATIIIGPVQLDKVNNEVQKLTSVDKAMHWAADPSHQSDNWIWACWLDHNLPETLGGKDLWHISLDKSHPGRSYQLGHALRICCLNPDGTPHVGACKAEPDQQVKDEVAAWYSRQGPQDCDPHQSRLAR